MKNIAKPRLNKVFASQYTFDVESLSHEGRGIAHYTNHAEHPADKQGKKVFIQFALPNERVSVNITRQSKRFEEGDTIDVIGAPSKHRVLPICDHFKVCGGCSLQHMEANEQIRFKRDVLQSHFQHFAGVEPVEWLSSIRGSREDYRRRARVGIRYLDKPKKLMMGFRERQSNRLVNINHCPVLNIELNTALPEIRAVLQGLDAKNHIGHIELSMGDKRIALLVRHTANVSSSDLSKLITFTEKKGWKLYLQPQGPETAHEVYTNKKDETGLFYTLPEFNLKLEFLPTDFTQVNAEVNQKMISLACKLLDLKQGEHVLDLFCGLGNFSLPLARCVGDTGKVVAVEGSEDMVKRGQRNAQLNEITHAHFYSQDLTKDFSQQSWAKEGFDALLIDPPRAGAEQVMHYIANFSAKRIVYISCDPATLARDTGILVQHGYQLRKAGVMDMFMHTSHVESITLFEKIEQRCNESE
ncbi:MULTISPECIES: 23S rRNA (uracil(1939)-C(5))-methyltransferase RlmD [Acinetobacter]|uniref:23S rRNA (uracil(1939)-C(5))-methyltransferase RlmD n=1 Tax=Acinetobacter TaxID=469 RepID=UPI0018A26FC0|nr:MULTISPECIES: 23S rRNA (uracil(1939)-C(5))-methyltransferase RlmD [Acinetobacter]MBF7689909.1 23S rRNA (uracil(1939)-C(5))-methyltransferase RlmD [Acinetobacter pollinis]MBF7692414.1 23S rRNA (uracil(1939)-C(5))-methyltransferase RlmD [Acinetobacter pollinis]MBF7697239.1 23S rRNA (uracil(1939)-C(5))-methyltransferase RlmD [Acinetobacter pollinis]MBF7701116.1 23S rRNA (uracil(1939)-C(5))-methyltransferase RlmD [Acinetobacter pollinis]WEV48476.1 23S rRNA (uracil(1939)-C(5))-methyltransferase 